MTVSLVQDALHLDANEWFIPLGVGDQRLGPAGLRLLESEHALVIGPPRSGKSTVLDAVASMVGKLRPDVVITAISTRKSPVLDAPEIRHVVRTADEVAAAVERIKAGTAPQLVLVDDADALPDPSGALASLLATGRSDLHLVVAARPDPRRHSTTSWGQTTRSPCPGYSSTLTPTSIQCSSNTSSTGA